MSLRKKEIKMKTERELFLGYQDQRFTNLIEYSKEHDCFGFKVANTDLERGVRLHTLNYGWKMWCASASREGYKLVPVEPTMNMCNQLSSNVENAKLIYKAVIEAVEK